MGSFTNGLVVGIGIGLLIAPKEGKELRQQLAQSFRAVTSESSDSITLESAQAPARNVQSSSRSHSRKR